MNSIPTNNIPKYSTYLKKTRSLIKNKENQTYLELLLTILAIIFFGFFALRPTAFTISELLNEIESKQEVKTKLDNKLESLVAAQASYDQTKGKLIYLEQAMPTTHKITEFTGQIEKLAQENQVMMKSFSYDPFNLNSAPIKNKRNTKEKAGNWDQIPFNVTVTGNYEQLRNFLTNLHQLRRTVIINDVSLQPPNKTQSETEINNDIALQMSINAETIYRYQK